MVDCCTIVFGFVSNCCLVSGDDALLMLTRPVKLFDFISFLKLGCFKRKESNESLLAPGSYMAGNLSELGKRQVLILWPWRLQLKHRRSARQRCLASSESPERGGRGVKAGREAERGADE
jgi:hypothetical protein